MDTRNWMDLNVPRPWTVALGVKDDDRVSCYEVGPGEDASGRQWAKVLAWARTQPGWAVVFGSDYKVVWCGGRRVGAMVAGSGGAMAFGERVTF